MNNITLSHPTNVVVKAELYDVHKIVEYMRRKPMIHDDKNEIKKPKLNQYSNWRDKASSPVDHENRTIGGNMKRLL